MKKILTFSILLFSLILSSCGQAKNQQQIIRIAFNQSENHFQYRALRAFGDALEQETAGAYRVEIAANELLGDQRAATELLQSGVIQMAVVASPILENFNRDFAVIGLPYIYIGLDHQEAVATSSILDPLYATMQPYSIKVVGFFTNGIRSIYTNKPIVVPQDLNGYKIRIMQSDTMKRMLDLMGGVGTPMSQGEVYTAIQQGVLDGGENTILTYVDFKHYEVAPYYSFTNHLIVPDLVIMNEAFFNSMPNEHQVIFTRLMQQTVRDVFTTANQEIEEAMTIATNHGSTFTQSDTLAFTQAVQPLHNDVRSISALTQQTYQDIITLRN